MENKEPRKVRNDLRCDNCSIREATHLVFFERYHKEIGRFSLINPLFVCDTCIELYKGNNQLYKDKPVILPFEKIGQADNRIFGILSKKKYEFNALALNPPLRKKIWRIKYVWKNA